MNNIKQGNYTIQGKVLSSSECTSTCTIKYFNYLNYKLIINNSTCYHV